MRQILIIGLAMMISAGYAQVDTSPDSKPFYSFYLMKKINRRLSADAFVLGGMRNLTHKPWLVQYNLGLNYRLDRIYTLSLTYGSTMYNYGNASWWEKHYPTITPNFLGKANFHQLGLRIKRDDRLGNKLKISNRILVQQFFPSLEKYSTRIQLVSRLSYRKSDLPMALKPFAQGALYYYAGGVPLLYPEDESDTLFYEASPNGWHRFRVKVGASFRPIKSMKNFNITAYYAWNREFNTNRGV